MFILLLPLIIGVFGYGFDSLRLLYVKNLVQVRADAATQAGVALNYTTVIDGEERVVLGSPVDVEAGETAMVQAYDNYGINTTLMRPPNSNILTCSGVPLTIHPNASTLNPTSEACAQATAIIGTPISNSDLCSRRTVAAEYGVQLRVNETVDTVFLRILGKNQFHLTNITSSSLVRGANC